MELKSDALLLRAADYGESDKMLTLLTADRGKLSAGIKGVKKANAKLRFAAQPFCFAEYVFVEKGERRTVISAFLHDGFYPLREDVTAFYAAASITEVCDKLLFEGMESAQLLVSAVQALKRICAGEVPVALLRFLLTALRLAGYPVAAAECPVCGRRPVGRMRFDMASGTFLCSSCGGGTPVSEVTYQTVRTLLEGGEEAEGEGVIRALRLLSAYIAYQAEIELSALEEYLRLV